MKTKDLYSELIEIAKTLGITVRRENGNFKTGFALLKDEELIIINKSASLETAASAIARSLPADAVSAIYIKPVVREFIEKENNASGGKKDFSLRVEY